MEKSIFIDSDKLAMSNLRMFETAFHLQVCQLLFGMRDDFFKKIIKSSKFLEVDLMKKALEHCGRFQDINQDKQDSDNIFDMITLNSKSFSHISLTNITRYAKKPDMNFKATKDSKAYSFKGHIIPPSTSDNGIGIRDVIYFAANARINHKSLIIYCGDSCISILFHCFQKTKYFSYLNLCSEVDFDMQRKKGLLLFTSTTCESICTFLSNILANDCEFVAYLFQHK